MYNKDALMPGQNLSEILQAVFEPFSENNFPSSSVCIIREIGGFLGNSGRFGN